MNKRGQVREKCFFFYIYFVKRIEQLALMCAGSNGDGYVGQSWDEQRLMRKYFCISISVGLKQ